MVTNISNITFESPNGTGLGNSVQPQMPPPPPQPIQPSVPVAPKPNPIQPQPNTLQPPSLQPDTQTETDIGSRRILLLIFWDTN